MNCFINGTAKYNKIPLIGFAFDIHITLLFDFNLFYRLRPELRLNQVGLIPLRREKCETAFNSNRLRCIYVVCNGEKKTKSSMSTKPCELITFIPLKTSATCM